MLRRFIVVVTVVLFGLPICLAAQTDFFYSFSDLNDGAKNSHASATFGVGDTGSLFIYFSTHNHDLNIGEFLDIATSASGVIAFTNAETFDFAINENDEFFSNRWLDKNGEGGGLGVGGISDNLIDELWAFTVTGGTGILGVHDGSNGRLDEGYDAGADAFLFGRIDFVTISTGQIDILTEQGEGIVCQCPDNIYGGATITVVPEPAHSVFMIMALCVANTRSIRRVASRRRH